MKYTIHFAVGLFLLFLISCSVSKINENITPEAPASPKPGDCFVCHESKEVLPQGHVDTQDMMVNGCSACHEAKAAGLWTKIPLSHLHRLAGLSCKDCHEDTSSPKAAGTEVCEKCHSDIGALIEETNDLDINPHYSPHEGKIPDCTKCHHEHKSSENYCAHCHGLDYKVP